MKKTIELDGYIHLSNNGVSSHVYLGDHDDEGIEFDVSWDTLIDNEFDGYIVPFKDGPIVVTNEYDGVDELLNQVDTLRRVATKLEERVKSNDILLRDEESRPVVDYAGYLDYVMKVKGGE